MTRKKLTGIILLSIVLFVLFFVAIAFLVQKPKVVSQLDLTTPLTTPVAAVPVSEFDGLPLAASEDAASRIVGVMIDNHADARPQSGLSAAGVVYEAPVEGGITRYLALFKVTSTVAEVGPVRSARPYFIDWDQEYGDALYLHSGGSPAALAFLKNSSVFDINEFYWGRYFWRSDERGAPHNLYTSSDRWQKIVAESAGERPVQPPWKGWLFASSTLPTSSEEVLEFLVPFSSNYRIGWKYDADQKKYQRFLNGVIARDTAHLLQAHNVVVQFTSVDIIDDEGRREIDTVGEGEVLVFHRGVLERGKWKKTNQRSRTRFYRSTGEEIVLTPGVTWVEVVPLGTDVVLTK